MWVPSDESLHLFRFVNGGKNASKNKQDLSLAPVDVYVGSARWGGAEG